MNEKYALYTGNEVKTVSLWVRRDGNEYPIYANTRGRSEWYSHDADVYENTEPHGLSDLFVEWLAHFYRYRNGLMRTDSESSLWADHVEEDRPDEEPEWYEMEILNAIDNPGMTPEQEELLEWAYEQVEDA